MHDSGGYTFHGSAPITGLTPRELDLLMLGHLVHQEQQEAVAEGSSQNQSMRKQKQRLRRGHQSAREDVFGDLGIH